LVGGFDGFEVSAPILGLVEIVGDALGIENSEGGGVEWVLRDGDKDACVR